MANHPKILIEGITNDGQHFRPSDWAKRLCGKLSTLEQHRIHYSSMIQPTRQNGVTCLLIHPDLELSYPVLYQSILDFARSNNLKISRESS